MKMLAASLALGAFVALNAKLNQVIPSLTASSQLTAFHTLLSDKKAGNAEKMQRGQDATWTILVYLHADHNLDPSSVADLEEMQEIGSEEGFDIIVQWDRLEEEGVTRGRVVEGKLETLEELDEMDSDDPKTLEDFIAWGVKKYPADRYGLILWDHGGQWEGFGGDETNEKEGTIMGLVQIKNALRIGMARAEINQWDFLSFDTCLMGGLEPLVQLADTTKLYIANPELDYGDGWEYTDALSTLKENPDMTLKEFARAESDAWKKHHSDFSSDIAHRAHISYDTTGDKVAALTRATKRFTSSLASVWGKSNKTLASERGRTIEYSIDTDDPHSPRDFIDLGDYAARTSAAVPELKASADALNNAIDNMIVARVVGTNNSKARGLSVWMPSDRKNVPDEEQMSAYQKLSAYTSTGWGKFIGTWFGTVKANTTPPKLTITAQKNAMNPTPAAPATVSYTVKDSDLNTLFVSVGRNSGDDTFDLYGDLYFREVKPGKFTTTWTGGWLSVTDGTKSDYFTGFLQDADDTFLYASALYTAPGTGKKSFPVSIVYDMTKKQIVSALDDPEEGTPRKINLKTGGTLAFQLERYNVKNDEITIVPTGGSVVIPAGGIKDLKVTIKRLPKGEYDLLLGAVDWAGNDTSESVGITLR
jgi:hypothetical protein